MLMSAFDPKRTFAPGLNIIAALGESQLEVLGL